MSIQIPMRSIDVVFMRVPFNQRSYKYIDYMNYVASLEFYPISGRLQEKPNFMTLTNPFDMYIWIFLLFTILSLISSLVLIEKVYNLSKMSYPSKDIWQQSMIDLVC